MLYFAYGSNLNKTQMHLRCPDSEEIAPAILPDYRIVERIYADIEPAPGMAVYGALYRISEADLKELDHYEGYPEQYIRREVMVRQENGEMIPALVYIMTPSYRSGRSRGYTRRYRQICSDGAESWKIPNAFQKEFSNL